MTDGYKIGGKIVLDGEKEYREAIKNINAEHKELRSEMKLCVSSYKENQNGVEALEKKYEILSKQTETQKEKIEIYSKAVADSTKKQEEAKNKVELLANEYNKAQKEMEEMKDSSDHSKEALEAQGKKVTDLKEELTKASKEYNNVERSTNSWKTSLNDTKTDLNSMETELQNTDKYLEEAKNSTDGCAISIDKFGKEAKDTGRELENTGEKAENFKNKSKDAVNALADTLISTGIAQKTKEIAKELLDCADAASQFEKRVAKISTVADLNVKSMSSFKEEILRVSSEMGTAVGELSEATYNAISASVETEESVAFAAQSTKLAIGGFTDTTTAVDVLTTTLNAYKLESEETASVSDMLVTTQNLGKTTVGELAASYGKVIPLAAAYNTNMANLSTSTALLTANGIKTAEAITYQKSMFNELGDSGSKVAKILEEQTGKSFADLMKSGSSLGDVMQVLGTSVNNDKTAFNNLWSSSEAGIGALSLLNTGSQRFNEVLGMMENSAGATDEAFEKMTDTSDYAQKRMVNAADNLKIAIGEELNPSLKELYETGGEAFTWASEFIKEHPEVVKSIAACVTGLATFTIGITAAKVAIIALQAVVNTNPIGLIATVAATTIAMIGTYLVTMESATEETKKYLDTQQEIIDKQNKAIETRKTEKESLDIEIATINKLEGELLELNKQESLTNEEKSKLKKLVDQLNQAMPELNLAIDEQTGHLKGTNEQTKEYIENTKEILLLDAARADLEETAKDLYEAEKTLVELREELKETTEQLTQKQEEYNVACEQGAKNSLGGISRREYMEYQGQIESLTEKKEGLIGLVEEEETAYAALDEEYNKNEESVNAYSEAIENNKQSLEGAIEHTIQYKGETRDISSATEETRQSIEALTDEYLKASEAAYDSISRQVGLFDELKIKSSITTQEMKANLESQTAGYTQYTEDLQSAATMLREGASPEFETVLDSIMSMGMDGAGYLNELVSAAKTNSEEFNEVMASFAEMEDAKTLLSTTMGDINTDYSDKLDEMLGIQTEKQEEQKVITETGTEEVKAIVLAANDAIVADTSDTMVEINAKIIEQKPVVVATMQDVVKNMIAIVNTELGHVEGKEPVFKEIGKKITDDLATGIEGGTSTVSGALTSMINSAVDSMDVSGIVSKIDKKLGESMK